MYLHVTTYVKDMVLKTPEVRNIVLLLAFTVQHVDPERTLSIHVLQPLEEECHLIIVEIELVVGEQVRHPSEYIHTKDLIEMEHTTQELEVLFLSNRFETLCKKEMGSTKAIEKVVEHEDLHFKVFGHLVILSEAYLLIV